MQVIVFCSRMNVTMGIAIGKGKKKLKKEKKKNLILHSIITMD